MKNVFVEVFQCKVKSRVATEEAKSDTEMVLPNGHIFDQTDHELDHRIELKNAYWIGLVGEKHEVDFGAFAML